MSQVVVQEDIVASPLGGLTFVYQFTNDSTSLTSIHRMTEFDYAGFIVDATFFGAGQDPLAFDRDPAGGVVGVDFSGANLVDTGETSAVLVFRTNAPDYQPGTILVINGSATFVSGFAPIPAPGEFALLGLAGVTVARRRRG